MAAKNKVVKKATAKTVTRKKTPYSLPSRSQNITNRYDRLPFKFIDLFAGIGGFRCAMTKLGGKCVFSNEWDKYSTTTYKAWYKDEDVNDNDIWKVNAKLIPDHDILCAGFPCQPFSIAGVSKKQSLGHKHGFQDVSQGKLFYRIMEIVDAKRPPVLFLENVKNLKSHDKGNTWKQIVQEIESRQYAIFSEIIDARSRVPQHRERIFIVCFDKKIFGNAVGFDFPNIRTKQTITLRTILEDDVDPKYMLSDKLWKYLKAYAKKQKAKGNGFGYGLNSPDDVARTMSARYYKDGAEILINHKGWKNPRRLTPREAQRLMGFNKRYANLFGHKDEFPQVVSDTQAYKQFGNSVVPLVVEEVGRQILKKFSDHIITKKTGGLLKY
ncbi:MAG: DNA (cytosine-5-)-methyltransferase [Acidiferrobacteraceae bacterium]|nr:DNA (cytosine-5-)-methyltransferase [Acidiferrobacteraceae bacterium]|tara:strand:- start:6775 stop:7920 length:1146 start_codon:yes stop_codon:yes gene_type:complete